MADKRKRRAKLLDANAPVAAGAGLIGATIGGIVTIWVTSDQINATDQAARREQRQTIYADVIVSAQEYERAVHRLVEVTPALLPGDYAGLDAASLKFESDLAALRLIAGREVELAAHELSVSLQDAEDTARQFAAGIPQTGENMDRVDQIWRRTTDLVEVAQDELD